MDQLRIATTARMATELPDLKPYHFKAANCYKYALRNGPSFDDRTPLSEVHSWLKDNLPEEEEPYDEVGNRHQGHERPADRHRSFAQALLQAQERENVKKDT